MLDELFHWTSGLDQQGWIAATLLLIFFVIMIVTVIMLLQLKSSSRLNNKTTPDKPLSKSAAVHEAKQAEKSDKDTATLVEEAEVFITYGLQQQAINALTQHLLAKPNDKKAQQLLEKARELKEHEEA